MSADSSKEQQQPGMFRRLLTPKKEWGIVMGVLIGVLALWGPYMLFDPVFSWIVPYLPFSANVKISLMTIVLELAAIGVIAAALLAYHKKFSEIGVARPKWLHLAQAFVAFVGYIVISILAQAIVRQLFGDSFNADEPQELGYKALAAWEIIAAFIPLVILTPIAEEVIFRGFMFKGVRRRAPFWVAAVAVSAIFGAVHGQWNVALDVFVMSMVGCYLVEKTGSLWPSIFLHVIKNGLAFSLVFLFNVA
jgi:membrane protease YdiL (CAAX protease family)